MELERVIVLAAKLHSSKTYDAMSAVERAMDLLDYEGDAFVDDVVAAMLAHKDVRSRDPEQEQLRLAENEMNMKVRAELLTDSREDNDWHPHTAANKNLTEDWNRTLNVIDRLADKLKD